MITALLQEAGFGDRKPREESFAIREDNFFHFKYTSPGKIEASPFIRGLHWFTFQVKLQKASIVKFTNLAKAYPRRLKLNEEKKDDLVKFKNVIPWKYEKFWKKIYTKY